MYKIDARIVRFILSGILATGTHSLSAYVLIIRLGWQPGPANACAFALATVVSYLGNTHWTFRAQHSKQLLFRFSVVVVGGCMVSWLIASTVASFGFAWWIGVAAIVMIVPAITWVAHKKWTYA